MKNNIYQKKKRQIKIRKKIFGTEKRPRLSVFRSNKHIFAQIINDSASRTLIANSSLNTSSKKEKISKTDAAALVGEELAKKALSKKIKKVSFDRSGYKYNGRIKALAEAARKGGLIF